MSEFFRNIRLRRYRDALYNLGCYLWTLAFGQAPSALTTPLERAIRRRQWVCGLIDYGLLHHPYRLDPHQWTREKCVLRTLEPTLKSLPVHLRAVSERARRVAVEQTGRGRTASFQKWANNLIEALEQYRRDCEAIHAE